ncbi:MAG: VCBS repeat-containing protein [Cyclobacteriaceae bacterium]|nr:VCBS repeat-containing protein [Cyclobacteriaceae bacterium]
MKRFFLAVLVINLLGCSQKPKFERLEVDRTGIDFINAVVETDTLHVMNFEYIYNGGGVGVADLNNDDLPDILFTGNQVPSKIYLNQGNFKFEDITFAFEELNTGAWYSGISIVDINNDGWIDLYITCTAYKDPRIRRNRFYINQGLNKDGIPAFIDKAEEYGVDDDKYSVQAAFLDYDQDGDLDLYVMNNFVTERLSASYREKILDGSAISNDSFYRNNGDNTFTNVTIEAGIVYEGFGLGIAVADVNKDGYPDIYISNDYVSNDLLYINQRNGTFKNEIANLFSYQTKSSMGNDMADINNDGLMDMFTLDMMPEYYYKKKQTINGFSYKFYLLDEKYGYEHQYLRNMLHQHNGFIRDEMIPYSEIGQLLGIYQTEWSWSPLFADYDNDGDKDLLISNGYPKDLTDKDWTKYKAEVYGSIADEKHVMSRAPAVKAHNYAFENMEGKYFEKRSDEWFNPVPSYSYGAAFVDLDNDGDLDYVVNNINDPAFVFKNNTIEKNKKNAGFIRIKLTGDENNTLAIGAKIELWAGDKYQYQEKFLSRGYISTVDPVIHFGVSDAERIDSIKITWSGSNHVTKLSDVPANQIIHVREKEGTVQGDNTRYTRDGYLFTKKDSILNYVHQEEDYIDFFNYQNILPHKFSQLGPIMEKGDINGDGLEDIIIGATNMLATKVMINTGHGFQETYIPGLTTHKDFAEADLKVIDYDNDGDMDVIAVAGGYINSRDDDYKHYLYVNINNEKFESIPLPIPGFSASVIRSCDFNHDGYQDIFIGSRIKKEMFPFANDSWILINDRGNFNEENSLNFNLGMVTDAVWSDFDGDGWEDLFIAREWNSVAILKNIEGQRLSSHLDENIDKVHGYWYSIAADDLDKDGNIDFILGNLGNNHRFTVSERYPMRIYPIDIETNGTLDPILTAYWKDQNDIMTEYPINYFDEMVAQIPFLTKIFPDYATFSYASVDEILTPEIRERVIHEFQMNASSSYILWNNGRGFEWEELPDMVQVSPVKNIIIRDITGDNLPDVIMGGNDYSYDVSTGYYDANKGIVMINLGNRNFDFLRPAESGLLLNGMIESLIFLDGDIPLVIGGRNRKDVIVYELNNE